MNATDMKIYAVTHKEVDFLPPERILIGVGKNKDINGVTVYDNTGENISEKNYSFCELTALYWIWKNETAPYIALEHYRRSFLKNKRNDSYLSKEALLKKLEKYDVVLPTLAPSKDTVYGYYCGVHIPRDLEITMEVVKELYPEYTDDLNGVLYSHKSAVANMFAMRKELVDAYAEWLFSILFEVEKRVGDVSNRDSYQIRVFGFLSERLFYVWVKKNKLKTFFTPITCLYDRRLSTRILNRIKGLFKKGE